METVNEAAGVAARGRMAPSKGQLDNAADLAKPVLTLPGSRSALRVLLLTLTSAAGLCGAQVSFAQEVPADRAAPGASASDPAATSDKVASDNDIVVTAERRSVGLQKTPQLLSVLSSDALARQQVLQPLDLQKTVPGVQLMGGGAQISLLVRGAGNAVANARGDAAAGYNIDGVAVVRPISVNGAFFDLDRIEVLKGPQGTLYGRNATVGAVNLISKRPTFDLGGQVEVEVGNYDLFRQLAVLNVPLSGDLAVRGAFQHIKRDGYLSNGANDANNIAGRLSALWQPSKSLSVVLIGNYFKDVGAGAGDVPLKSSTGSFLDPKNPWYLAVVPFPGNLNTAVPDDARQRLRTWSVSAEITADLGPATLTIIPAAIDNHYKARTYNGGFLQLLDTTDRQQSVETRLASHAGSPFTWLVGGLYLHDNQTGYSDLNSRPGILQRTYYNNLSLTSYALFAQGSYPVLPDLTLTGGLRYSHDEKRIDGYTQNLDLQQQPIGVSVPSLGRSTFDNVSFKVGAEWALTPRNMLYANVATGYKAGGFNGGLAPNTYKPEKMTAYTVGAKNRFLHDRLTFNVEAWYWDYRDVQQVAFGFINPLPNFQLVTFNASAIKSYGAELQSSLRIGAGGNLDVAVVYTHSTYGSFFTPAFPITGQAAADNSGLDTPFAPRWAVNLGYEHRIGLGGGWEARPAVRTQIRSSQRIVANPVLGNRVDGTTTTDLSLAIASPAKGLEVQFYANNLEDEPVIQFAGTTPAGFWAGPGRPRTYGVRTTVRF